VSVRAGLEVRDTYVFDSKQSRRGYHLNKLCLSLRSASTRALFCQDEAAYCDSHGSHYCLSSCR
jgi:protocatechuate 4,5-dioxygenase alpha chain